MEPIQPTPDSVDDKVQKHVQVLSRGLILLKAFRPSNKAMTNGELAQVTGLPRPTISRITATLMAMGYLDYLAETTQYRLGNAALALGFGILSTLDGRLRARERMQRFAEEEDLLVVLSIRDRMTMACQVVCRGRGALTVRLEVGSRVILPKSAMGRAWVASLDAAAYDRTMSEIEQQFPNENLVPSMAEAGQQLMQRGFCITINEVEPDVMGAATIVNLGRTPSPYALGCAVPAFRYRRERSQAELGSKLMALRQQIEQDSSFEATFGTDPF